MYEAIKNSFVLCYFYTKNILVHFFFMFMFLFCFCLFVCIGVCLFINCPHFVILCYVTESELSVDTVSMLSTFFKFHRYFEADSSIFLDILDIIFRNYSELCQNVYLWGIQCALEYETNIYDSLEEKLPWWI